MSNKPITNKRCKAKKKLGKNIQDFKRVKQKMMDRKRKGPTIVTELRPPPLIAFLLKESQKPISIEG
jgi:hypothetical protein